MRFKEIFIVTKGTKVVLAITLSVSLLTLLFAYFYYQGINKAQDPRVNEARAYLFAFDKIAVPGIDAFHLLDSAAKLYGDVPDYANSFEHGLIYNNKASVLLRMALYDSSLQMGEKEQLIALSMAYCDSSIQVYRDWLAEWEDEDAAGIAERIKPLIHQDDPCFSGHSFDKIFAKRIKEIQVAQLETPRRLSVSLTNKGTLFRHQQLPDSALLYYQQAITLWKHNRTAKSNLKVLLGGEPVKPTVIETLFPPDKNKK